MLIIIFFIIIDAIRRIAESVRIPVIANGGSNDIECYADIEKFKNACGSTSVMIARMAQRNVSIFRKEGLIPIDQLVPAYLKLCIDYDNSLENTKYSIQKIHKNNGDKIEHKKFSREFENATELRQIWCVCVVLNYPLVWKLETAISIISLYNFSKYWGLYDYCVEKQKEYAAKGHITLPCTPQRRIEDMTDEMLEYRKSMYGDPSIHFAMMKFNRKYFSIESMPKCILINHADENKLPRPVYETKREDRLHYTVVTYDNQKYASLLWAKEKQIAEQTAALVCAHRMGLLEQDFLIAVGCLLEEAPMDYSLAYGA